ncbi:Hsp33 family molecular chaperone HslO [Conchiformibius kuhniae]|uniref:Hsp33 family molecular chaperone HslO n=1 Tax=Conchiformibius kuhniae TaxID=211502 RepID=A0A8T9MT53_9NEIS|nr:Hsp33 family molecular chaperone HslO [Conchiformibius kuhniae]UOP04264.1 Hsp33 family molecular chaperone HslO [Conchiformibius kuhniae]
MNQDQRCRFLFDHHPARGLHVRLNVVWQHILQRKNYPPAVRRALGELLAAAALLAEDLKSDSTLTIQVQGTGALKMLVAEAACGQTCRATARWDEHADIARDARLSDLLGKDGICAITVQPRQGEAWQGIVPLDGDNIAQMLSAYMRHSQQIDTHIVLTADEHRANGFLLQRLPAGSEDAWAEVLAPAQTLSRQELHDLNTEALLYRLFHQTPPRLFPAEELEFACTCSRSKVADMLLLLGCKEVGDAIGTEGSIGVDCDFCGERYTFDQADADALFGTDVLAAAQAMRNMV